MVLEQKRKRFDTTTEKMHARTMIRSVSLCRSMHAFLTQARSVAVRAKVMHEGYVG